MPKRTKDYQASLLEDLQDPEEATAYLNASLSDSDAPDSEELFLLALRNIAEARGMSQLSEETGLGRESLYKTLSKQGNPKLATLFSLLNAMGLKMAFQVNKQRLSQQKARARQKSVV